MTIDEKVTLVQSLLEEEEDEEIVNAFLVLAGDAIIRRAYPFNGTVTEVPSRYDVLQCKIAVFLINKMGAEGETLHIENGTDRHFENGDIPPSMLNEVVPFSRGIGEEE